MTEESTPVGDFEARIAAAYASQGAALELGRGMLGGTVHPDAVVRIPAAMCNRHGLIAGATGTGKTKTLQVLAEQLSALGVPVFAADVKGDLAGMSRPGEANEKVTARVDELSVEWNPAGFPVSFLSLGGLGPGVPVRPTRLLLRRGPPDLRRRLRGVPRPGGPDRASDPLQGRGRLLRHPASRRRPRGGPGPAGQPHPARPRAFTPRDAKALKAAVTTYPKTADYDLEEDLTQLGTGEAMVTILSERGAPTPVVWTRLCPPHSLMAAIEAEGVAKAAEADPLWGKYAAEVDRESAREKLAARLAGATEAAPQSVEDLEVPPAPPPPPPPSAGGAGAGSRAATPSSTTSRPAKAAPWSTP